MTDLPVKDVRIAVAMVIRDGNLLLLERRDANPMWDHKWEFPGGKIEEGEHPENAMRREVIEETGLEVIDAEFLGLHLHKWYLPDRILQVYLHCFRCGAGEGDIVREERGSYSHVWTKPQDALAFDLLEANADLIRKFL
ncbi:hypothetical protein A2348_02490 [Candidatus Uhrbacteria bacterium RIFOXYB12_FULL_58_10]|uniref:8-oxo-dGTP diphosphatase n=1 Tax=Candidatus Uhrbacteria bacterium RIFOXYB2_FULL_57_15 TaxID=1802422 RepID=A0A1F7W5U8_9BACT|nr:MAG: hypothetical protein A2348_02490 [Candidatus Uhrbacteria bacterium RIFOXYB12_FULL_58_10]OGL98192.1 MAG: hypothetical protein A2304_03720 [Candidatus Uhrbacteria bacterium RIFOXYB2_FULL_57_15]OGL99166.1 MAG: hypothetical protein A2501_03135 [Candidatus Uhrbacteria bacterium RIFOXYC12_FULL_57_11]